MLLAGMNAEVPERIEVPLRASIAPDRSPSLVLVVALTAAGTEHLADMLATQGIEPRACEADKLATQIGDPLSAAALIEEEALSPAIVAELSRAMARDPTLAGFPYVVLTGRGPETTVSRRLEEERLPLGQTITLERPERAGTLASNVHAAVRARRLQVHSRHQDLELDRAQRAVAKAQHHHQSVLRTTGDCVKLLDLEGGILSMNVEGQRRLGIQDFESVRSRNWSSLWMAEHQPAAHEMVRKALDGQDGHFGTEFASSNTHGWWDVTVTPMRDGSGAMTHLLAIAREVTRRKQTEKALVESEKLAAVGRLAASIAHEINNPLEAVTNLLYLIGLDTELSLATQSYLKLADRELARVSRIAGQMLRFHRAAPRPRSVTPEELLEPVLALYQGQLLRARVSIDIDARDEAPITCYEGDIRQVLNNLVGNAIDAMGSGGRLRIRARRGRDWCSHAHGTRITVADTGHGISPLVKRRIFDAFFTTKGLKGSGLGLWISHGIVQKHGGRLRVRSRSEGVTGTVFSLFLPADPVLQQDEAERPTAS